MNRKKFAAIFFLGKIQKIINFKILIFYKDESFFAYFKNYAQSAMPTNPSTLSSILRIQWQPYVPKINTLL